MDFSVDRENSTVRVKREFSAPKDDVWAAWTEPEILDQWWAPRPWKSKTKKMEFKVGGRRLYAMLGPEGEEHWAVADYTSITPKTNFKYRDAFCDSEGNIDTVHFLHSDWSLDFTARNGTTVVDITIKHQSLADLEKVIEVGFKEGFTTAMEGLDEIFASREK